MTLSAIRNYGTRIWQYARQARRTPNSQLSPSVYFDFRTNVFNRYAYLLLRFFSLCDWQVLVRHRFRLLASNDPYSTLWLNEPNVRLALGRPRQQMLRFHEGEEGRGGSVRLSPDYFSQAAGTQSIRVPMAMHPLLYHSGLWNAPLHAPPRRAGVFFAGTFDRSIYSNSALPDLFSCSTRLQMLEFVRQNLAEHCQFPRTVVELERSVGENRIVYVDREYFSVPLEKIRETLAKYAFFLAHPGVTMPLCHNVVESLSAGCIPILQEGYARILHPNLKTDHNCVTFASLSDMGVKLREVLAWNGERIEEVQRNVRELYDVDFTPAGVVRSLCEGRNDLQVVYLQAEHYSVEKMRRARGMQAVH